MVEAEGHWHAFGWSGGAPPPDGQAKDRGVPVMPIDLNLWFSKPRKLHFGIFSVPEDAYEWMAKELSEAPSADPSLTAEQHLAHVKGRLDRFGDGYAGYYTRGGFIVRVLLRCPRAGVVCPK